MSTKIIFHQQLAAVTDSSFQKNLPILEWLVTKLFQKYSNFDVRKCGDRINFISTTRSVERGSGSSSDVVIDNPAGFIWRFSGFDKYLVKYLKQSRSSEYNKSRRPGGCDL